MTIPKVLYEIRHSYPIPPNGGASIESEALPLVVYLRLRTVSITLTSTVLEVLGVVVGGGGSSDLPVVGMLPSDLPVVGISPAKIEVDSAHISASAIANRFMNVAPFEVEKMPKFLYRK